MLEANDHSVCVDAWVERAAEGLPPAGLVRRFEQAFGALWRRARVTLGEVTLGAIVDRVLYSASERHPILATLRLESTGLRCEELAGRADGLPRAELAEGIRFVLTEFLTVLGNLTAEILTPALHAELSKFAEGEDRAEAGSPSAPGPDEGAES
jgi:hypothetical protein